MPNWFSRIALGTAVLVLLGCVAAPAQVLKGSRGEEYSPQWGGFQAEILNQQLKLTPQQQAQIRPILENEQNQFAQIRESAGQKIQAVLDPGQQKRFNPQWGGRQAGRAVPVYSPQWGGFMLRELTHELKLSKEQQARISPVLTQAQTEFQGAHQKAGGQIASALHADQQKKFQAMSRNNAELKR